LLQNFILLNRQSVGTLDLHEEVQVHGIGPVNLDIQLRAFWRSQGLVFKSHRTRILLTGATGFLGAFLLKELLLHTKVCTILNWLLCVSNTPPIFG